jgi:uncharacterized protein with PQ loop repeat
MGGELMIIRQNKLIKATYFVVTLLAIAATIWLISGTITGYFRASYKTFQPSQNGLVASIFASLLGLVLLWYLGKWFAKRFTG